MRWIARWVGVLVATVLPLLAWATQSQAKLPSYTIEWSPELPVVGEVVRFTVRFWDDAENTERARWVDMRAFDAVVRIAPVSAEPTEGFRVHLERARPGVYRGETTLPSAGHWAVCMWEFGVLGDPACPRAPAFLVLPTASAAEDVDHELVAADDGLGSPTLPPMGLALVLLGSTICAAAARRAWRSRRPGL